MLSTFGLRIATFQILLYAIVEVNYKLLNIPYQIRIRIVFNVTTAIPALANCFVVSSCPKVVD